MQQVPKEATILSMVRCMMKVHRIAALHLDEAQHIIGKNRAGDISAVGNTMKSLMKQEHWPIMLVLSGTENLRALINSDPQLSMAKDQRGVAGTMENFAKLANL